MLPLMPPGTETSQIRRKPVATRMEMMPHQIPLIERRVATMATVATFLEPLGKTTPCAITDEREVWHDPPAPRPRLPHWRAGPVLRQGGGQPRHQGPPQGGRGSCLRRPHACPGGPRGRLPDHRMRAAELAKKGGRTMREITTETRERARPDRARPVLRPSFQARRVGSG